MPRAGNRSSSTAPKAAKGAPSTEIPAKMQKALENLRAGAVIDVKGGPDGVPINLVQVIKVVKTMQSHGANLKPLYCVHIKRIEAERRIPLANRFFHPNASCEFEVLQEGQERSSGIQAEEVLQQEEETNVLQVDQSPSDAARVASAVALSAQVSERAPGSAAPSAELSDEEIVQGLLLILNEAPRPGTDKFRIDDMIGPSYTHFCDGIDVHGVLKVKGKWTLGVFRRLAKKRCTEGKTVVQFYFGDDGHSVNVRQMNTKLA